MSTKIGQIVSIATTTTGTVKVEGVGIRNYNGNASIPLTIGGYVLGSQTGAGNMGGMVPLDTPWSLVSANANNLLSLAKVQSALISAKCCAVKKGVKLLADEERQVCVEDEENIETMFSLADSISCIVPEGEIIEGRQAVYAWNIETLNLATHNVTVTIGAAVYSFTTTSSNDKTVIAAEIAAYINTFYPQNYQYQAESFANFILIWANDFDLSNGTVVNATITNGAYDFYLTPKQLGDGTASVAQGANNITNNQIQQILSRLCALCKN